jgi:hypothetical protein
VSEWRKPEEEEPKKKNWRKEIKEAAEFLSKYEGGDYEEYVRMLTEAGRPFDDECVTKDGYRLVGTYDYRVMDGTLIYQVLRYQYPLVRKAKRFLIRRPGPPGIEWVFGSPDNLKIIYNWPAVAANPEGVVYFCEGENKADRLIALGLVATTVPGQNWSPEAAEALRGMSVVIVEDNDSAGKSEASDSVRALHGVTRSVRRLRLPGLEPGLGLEDWLDAGHTRDELVTLADAAPTIGLSAEPYEFPDEATIPAWDFIYGRHLLRGTVSVTAASGETGKTTKSVAEALAMTTGKPLLGVAVARQMRVLLINLEDDRDSMAKRIAAAMKHYGLTPADVGDRLTVVARGELRLKLAGQVRGGRIEVDRAAVDDVVAFSRDRGIDVISVDPLRKTHQLNESDNVAMGELIEVYEEIAAEANASVHVWHHMRKGNGSDASVDSVRGASSIIDAARSVRVMEKMTEKAAEAFSVDERRRYFRSYNGKLNFAPPVDESEWFEIQTVTLDNAGFGDSVGVITCWTPPDVDDLDISQAVISDIKERVGDEPKWKEHFLADVWVGKVVGPAAGLDPRADRIRVMKLIEKLIREGHLMTKEAMDTGRREMKMFVVVDRRPRGVAPQPEETPVDAALRAMMDRDTRPVQPWYEGRRR